MDKGTLSQGKEVSYPYHINFWLTYSALNDISR